jgi:hypothetical protein
MTTPCIGALNAFLYVPICESYRRWYSVLSHDIFLSLFKSDPVKAAFTLLLAKNGDEEWTW